MNRFDFASTIAIFLINKGQKSYGEWSGKLSAKEQREAFGCFLGKGTIYVDGINETVECLVKVCFGTDIQTAVSINAKKPEESFVNFQGNRADEIQKVISSL